MRRIQEKTLSFSDQVEANSKQRNGMGIGITGELYLLLTKKYGKGNGVSITSLEKALQEQEIKIYKPKGRTGVWTITLRPAGDYILHHKTDGLSSEKKFLLIK